MKNIATVLRGGSWVSFPPYCRSACRDKLNPCYREYSHSGFRVVCEEEEGQPTSKIIRGGAWNNNPESCRSADRNYNDPGGQHNGLGFRVVCAE